MPRVTIELFQKALLGSIDRNEKVVFKYLDDAGLAADIVQVYATLAQARARVAYQEHCPIAELLDSGGENRYLDSSRPSGRARRAAR